jgi:hypothetical protein
VYTDHKKLENYDNQKELSRRQSCWQEYMSQFDIKFVYVKGKDNTVADALSRLPSDVSEVSDVEPDDNIPAWQAWKQGVNAVLSVSADKKFLADVRKGYESDTFCKQVIASMPGMKGVSENDGLWYVGDGLLIPRYGSCREDLFRLAHDSLRHFGADKAYAA